MRRIVCVLLAAALLLSVCALADGDPWDCPNCGRKMNQTNYCGNCGTQRPAAEAVLEIHNGVLTGYTGVPVDLKVPEGVREIAAEAFFECRTLRSVSLPSSLRKIGVSAFERCDALERVTIMNGLATVGAMAFLRCGRLTSLTLPATVTSIGDHAFTGCSRLTIACPYASTAERYCIDHSLPYAPYGTKPTPTPTPTPTPKPTPTPRTFEISSVLHVEKGRVTLSWTDTANNGPYQVWYKYYGDGEDWPEYGDYSTSVNSFTFDQLVPGTRYMFTVVDKDHNAVSRIITVPKASSFVDGQLTASAIEVKLEPRRRAVDGSYNNMASLRTLKAADIMADHGKKEYGLTYTVRHQKLSRQRTYFTQVAFIAPNGYTACELGDEWDYGGQYWGRYWYQLGDYTFDTLMDWGWEIPTGTWTVQLYWDGMLVNTSTFDIN